MLNHNCDLIVFPYSIFRAETWDRNFGNHIFSIGSMCLATLSWRMLLVFMIYLESLHRKSGLLIMLHIKTKLVILNYFVCRKFCPLLLFTWWGLNFDWMRLHSSSIWKRWKRKFIRNSRLLINMKMLKLFWLETRWEVY